MTAYADTPTHTAAFVEAKAAATATANMNWRAATASAEFKNLIKKKRRTIPWILIPPLALFFVVTLLAGFARPLLSEKLFGGVALGYLLVLAIYLACWIAALVYVRVADSVFDPLAQKVADKIREGAQS